MMDMIVGGINIAGIFCVVFCVVIMTFKVINITDMVDKIEYKMEKLLYDDEYKEKT